MHFYSFHIGDYAAHTRHLSLLEDLAYRRLLDVCYMKEAPLPDDIDSIARQIGMRDHIPEVQAVIDEFFEWVMDCGYIHPRVDAEIRKTGRKRELASKAGKASAAKRERESNGRSTGVEQTLNGNPTDVQPPDTHYPLPSTKEQTPLKSGGSKGTRACARPDEVPLDLWNDWVSLRKAKKAPVTPRVLKGLSTEGGKANLALVDVLELLVTNGWQGFRAEYVTGKNGAGKPKSTREMCDTNVWKDGDTPSFDLS